VPSRVFRELREQLDQYSVGFPETKSGVEIKLLEKLFDEEEARMYLQLSMMLETPQAIAERTKRDPTEVGRLLERMAEKGLVFRLRKKGTTKYAAVAFVVGIYEFQVNTMDRELAELMEQYMEEAFTKQISDHTAPMRTIPVNRAISVSWPVAPYEDARQIVQTKDRIAVTNCICRVQQGLLEKGCEKPLEVCFSFGSHADYYVEKGISRWISQEEALIILDSCEEAGLVPQPFNAQNPGGMCNCCGDCCGILRALKKQPKPAASVIANYYAVVDSTLCSGCETCLDRCQMEAITVGPDAVAHADLDRCIGCGLCVSACPTEALELRPRPEGERREPPAKAQDTMMELAQKRGKSIIPLVFTKSPN
jgi:NAD-dependent dihydropyrimidine dehydrogenase PreA subunit